jgi:thiol:disulfide interchange protein
MIAVLVIFAANLFGMFDFAWPDALNQRLTAGTSQVASDYSCLPTGFREVPLSGHARAAARVPQRRLSQL